MIDYYRFKKSTLFLGYIFVVLYFQNKGLLPWQYETDSFHPELQTAEVAV